MKKFTLFFFIINCSISQTINLNNDFIYQDIRYKILNGGLSSDYSLNIRPIQYDIYNDENLVSEIFKSRGGKIKITLLPIDYHIEFNSRHPYNRNNGSMIPNRGFQHIFSPGINFKVGPLSIKLKPEHHFSENKNFEGFWDGHYGYHWAKRYKLWNHIDMPERYGESSHNRFLIGQSSIRINWKKLSIGLSNENIWWGPSIRNSIMMSNHAQGFNHITLNTIRPINTVIGDFEFQVITGKLEKSGYNPPRTDYEYAGTKLFVPKINQRGEQDDWRFLQGYIFSYSPKWINGLSLGLIRWVQMYSALVKGEYPWLDGKSTYFPAFQNFFRKNDKSENYEQQTNQAAGIFLKWLWLDSKAEIYAEFHHNDSKQNLRDLLLDSDHSRAVTIGIQKIFKIKQDNYLFNWEWTQMEQNASRLLRNAGSWYEHSYVYDGYTNKGEVLGSSIGPGSNSHYFSINRVRLNEKIGIGIEVVDQDNDFYHEAFALASDYRRYWKDINLHLNFNKKFKNFILSNNLIYSRSLNYQWELDDGALPYYHPGNDTNNFSVTTKISYLIK